MMSMTKKSRITTLLLSVSLSYPVLCCQRSQAATEEPASNTTSATQAPADEQGQSKGKLTKVVFVGKEHACDCTRKSIEAGWAALQQALGTPPKLPVERLQIDTQPDRVAPYRSQKAMMALPAIYFVDGKDAVVELLQGEVSAAQIAAVLGK
jgi:hypothetical protein